MSLAALVSSNPLTFHSSTSSCAYRIKCPNPTFLPPHRVVHLASLHLPIYRFFCRCDASSVSAGVADADAPHGALSGFDAFLSMAEVLCMAPSLVFAVGCAVGCFLPGGTPKLFQIRSGNVFFAGQLLTLVAVAAVGCLIRHRQWQRICRRDSTGASVQDFVQRIKKVEEDMRGSATVVRVLSRQLEKLGLRFRVTRRTLKDTISGAALLAQQNSEATRALVVQTDILEKELKEIQKVILAMQEQQEKQLELLIAIGKVGNLFENKKRTISRVDAAGNDAVLSGNNEVLHRLEAPLGNTNKS